MLPESPAPGWGHTLIVLLLGAGGARLLDVWLENRRLEKKDYRETLSNRIEALENDIDRCHARSAELQERVGRLEERLRVSEEDRDQLDEENMRLRERLLEVDPDRNPDLGG